MFSLLPTMSTTCSVFWFQQSGALDDDRNVLTAQETLETLVPQLKDLHLKNKDKKLRALIFDTYHEFFTTLKL